MGLLCFGKVGVTVPKDLAFTDVVESLIAFAYLQPSLIAVPTIRRHFAEPKQGYENIAVTRTDIWETKLTFTPGSEGYHMIRHDCLASMTSSMRKATSPSSCIEFAPTVRRTPAKQTTLPPVPSYTMHSRHGTKHWPRSCRFSRFRSNNITIFGLSFVSPPLFRLSLTTTLAERTTTSPQSSFGVLFSVSMFNCPTTEAMSPAYCSPTAPRSSRN